MTKKRQKNLSWKKFASYFPLLFFGAILCFFTIRYGIEYQTWDHPKKFQEYSGTCSKVYLDTFYFISSGRYSQRSVDCNLLLLDNGDYVRIPQALTEILFPDQDPSRLDGKLIRVRYEKPPRFRTVRQRHTFDTITFLSSRMSYFELEGEVLLTAEDSRAESLTSFRRIHYIFVVPAIVLPPLFKYATAFFKKRKKAKKYARKKEKQAEVRAREARGGGHKPPETAFKKQKIGIAPEQSERALLRRLVDQGSRGIPTPAPRIGWRRKGGENHVHIDRQCSGGRSPCPGSGPGRHKTLPLASHGRCG